MNMLEQFKRAPYNHVIKKLGFICIKGAKEMRFCQKLQNSYPYIIANKFKIWFTLSGFKEIGIRKYELVAKTQFISSVSS